jgi:hypothetical protein
MPRYSGCGGTQRPRRHLNGQSDATPHSEVNGGSTDTNVLGSIAFPDSQRPAAASAHVAPAWDCSRANIKAMQLDGT